MSRKITLFLALALVVSLAAPAMAYTGTFTNADQNNNFSDPNNWIFGADTNGAVDMQWNGTANVPRFLPAASTSGDLQTLVFGAGLVGTDFVDPQGTGWQTTAASGYQYPGTDIVTFVGSNGFTVGGGFWWNGPCVINVLGTGTFNIGNTGSSNYGGGPDGLNNLTINAGLGSTLIDIYRGRSTSSTTQTIINGGGTVELDADAVVAFRGAYCNLVLNPDGLGNAPTVNYVHAGDEQEVETLVGTGTVNFTALGGAGAWGGNLDSTTGFTGTVSVEDAALYVGGSTINNVNFKVGDYARLGTFGAAPVITGGSITGGGPSASAKIAGDGGVYGNVTVNGTATSTTLTFLGTTIAPSTTGNEPIYNSSNVLLGQTVASTAGKLVISSADDWGLNHWAPFALTFGKNVATPTQLGIAVAGTNQVAGVDFSQVQVYGTLSSVSQPTGNPLADTALVVNIKPGMTGVGINGTNLGSDPLYNQTLTILAVTGTNLAGTTFGAGIVGTDIKFNGGFATVNYASDGNGGGVVTLTGIFSNPTLAGDANNDGQVNGADYAFWAANYGANNATWLQGDFNNDGQVNGADYAIWAANYGTGSGTSATPEPISMIILAIGGGLVALKRRHA
jgi:hypothetical protein